MFVSMRRLTVAVTLVGAATPTTLAVSSTAPRHLTHPAVRHSQVCDKLFTPTMGRRAALRIYSGTRKVPEHGLKTLGYIERCQRNPKDTPAVRAFDHAQQVAWHARRYPPPPPPLNRSIASWYDDAGATASGSHYYYGVAHLSYGFGTHVQICYPWNSSHCVTATVDDRGPYISGREWDLNQNVASALGFSGVDSVGWRIVN